MAAPTINLVATKAKIDAAADTSARATALIQAVVDHLNTLAPLNGGAMLNELSTLAGQLKAAMTYLSNAVANK